MGPVMAGVETHVRQTLATVEAASKAIAAVDENTDDVEGIGNGWTGGVASTSSRGKAGRRAATGKMKGSTRLSSASAAFVDDVARGGGNVGLSLGIGRQLSATQPTNGSFSFMDGEWGDGDTLSASDSELGAGSSLPSHSFLPSDRELPSSSLGSPRRIDGGDRSPLDDGRQLSGAHPTNRGVTGVHIGLSAAPRTAPRRKVWGLMGEPPLSSSSEGSSRGDDSDGSGAGGAGGGDVETQNKAPDSGGGRLEPWISQHQNRDGTRDNKRNGGIGRGIGRGRHVGGGRCDDGYEEGDDAATAAPDTARTTFSTSSMSTVSHTATKRRTGRPASATPRAVTVTPATTGRGDGGVSLDDGSSGVLSLDGGLNGGLSLDSGSNGGFSVDVGRHRISTQPIHSSGGGGNGGAGGKTKLGSNNHQRSSDRPRRTYEPSAELIAATDASVREAIIQKLGAYTKRELVDMAMRIRGELLVKFRGQERWLEQRQR